MHTEYLSFILPKIKYFVLYSRMAKELGRYEQ